MYISEHPQGSQEWALERSRHVTGSEAYRILPPKRICSKCGNENPESKGITGDKESLYCEKCCRHFTLKSKGDFLETAYTYAYSIVGSKYRETPPQQIETFATKWGHKYEPIALEIYEEKTTEVVETRCFIKPDKQSIYGCSLDATVGGSGILEIKCPLLVENYVKYVLGEWKKHLPQIQFNLFVADKKWCDFVAYHPDLEERYNFYTTRIYTDKALHKVFTSQLAIFEGLLQQIETDFITNMKDK